MIRRFFSFFDPGQAGFARRMLRLLALLALPLLLVLCGSSALALRSEVGRYVMARALLDQEANMLAASLAGDLAEEFPEEWEYHRIEAWALRRTGEYGASLAIYERAVEQMPENWWPYSHLCFYSTVLADPEPVMEACDRSVELAPAGNYMAAYRRGLARMRVGELEGALSDLETAFEFWPEGENLPQLEDAQAYAEALRRGESIFDDTAIARERERYQ